MAAKNMEIISGHFVARNIFPARTMTPMIGRAKPTFIIDLQCRKGID
jgi:hypothetical protein